MKDQIEMKIRTKELSVVTEGFAAKDMPEYRVSVADKALLSEAETFLHFIVSYMDAAAIQIKDGETVGYGYWHVKFQRSEDWYLEAWEYDAHVINYVPGANLTLTYWRDQHSVCNKFQTEFNPPQPDNFVMISKGVLKGLPVEGVRYPSPQHMSGWWITTDLYDGNVKSMRKEHIYHLTASRPELTKYIALPFGFCINLEHTEHVYFDQEVANSPP